MTDKPKEIRAEDTELGKAIRKLRQLRGLSQEALAAQMGITFQQVQKYEKGVNRVSFSRFIDICTALECHPMDLIGVAYEKWRDASDATFIAATNVAEKQREAMRAAIKVLQEAV